MDVQQALLTGTQSYMMDTVDENAKQETKMVLAKTIDNVLKYDGLLTSSSAIEGFMKTAIQKYRLAFLEYTMKSNTGTLNGEDAYHFACNKEIWKHLKSLVELDDMKLDAVLQLLEKYSIPVVVDLLPEGMYAPVLYNTLKSFFVGEHRTWDVSFATLMNFFAFDITSYNPQKIVVKMLISPKKVEIVERVLVQRSDVLLMHEKGFYKVMFDYTETNISTIADLIHIMYGNGVCFEDITSNLTLVMQTKIPEVKRDSGLRVYIKHLLGDMLKDFENTHFNSILKA